MTQATLPGTTGIPPQFHRLAALHPRLLSPIALSVLLVLGACATPAPPSDAQIAKTQAGVAHATAMGANEYAPEDMQLARDRLGRARTAAAAGDFALATRLSLEADKDLEVAEARLQAVKAERAAAELRKGRRVLEGEIQRKAQ